MRSLNILLFLFLNSPILFAQSKEDWINKAMENNPNILALEAKMKELSKSGETLYEWAATQIDFSVIEWTPKDINPYYRPTLSISQEIPWFGTRKSKQANFQAQYAYQDMSNKQWKALLVKEIADQYAELQFLKEQKVVLVEQAEVLDAIYQNLLVKLETNQVSAWELILLENEQKDLEAAMQKSENKFQIEKQIFELLIGQEIQDLELEALKLPEIGLAQEIGNHPRLSALEAEKQSLEASKSELKLEYAPKLSLGLHYEAAMPVEPTYLTDDMIMPSIGLSIPIFHNKKKNKMEKLNLAQASLDAEILNEKNLLAQELKSIQTQFFDSQTDYQVSLAKAENLEEAMDLLWTAYEANKVNFQEVNRIKAQQIQNKLEHLSYLKIINQQEHYLNYLSQN